MTKRSVSPETLDLVLAVHAGFAELESIEDDAKREEVRALHEELLQSAAVETETEDHLPAWLIAAWPRIGDRLEPIEREAVELHLASCEACRAELSVLIDIRREGEFAAPRAGRPRALLLIGGWAVLATAASLFLWIRTPAPTQLAEPVSALVPATVRGEGDGPVIELPAASTAVVLDLGQIFPGPLRREILDAGTERVLFVAEGPAEAGALAVGEQSAEDFSRSPSFVLKYRSGEALVAGRYVFRAWLLQGGSATAGEEFSFQLRLDSPN